MNHDEAPVLDAAGNLPQGEAKAERVEAMFDRIAPTYERANRLISLGLDHRWRRIALDALGLRRGSRVLDLACGTGDLCRALEQRQHAAIGVDVSAGMLANARTDAPLVRADILQLPAASASVDGVICGFALRNVVSIDAFFAECARVLRPGGRMVILDAMEPESAVMRFGHSVWFGRIVPLLGRTVSRDPQAYAYLAKSTAYLPEPETLIAITRAAGFANVERRSLTGGAVFVLSASRGTGDLT
jgi:demethylmenaquinone methyltransferase/2-methoxy-6-polyprenyl-1,4-benzoquinol methylase